MPEPTTSWRMLTPAFRNSKRRKGFFSAPSGWMPPPLGLISCWEKYWQKKARPSLPCALCSVPWRWIPTTPSRITCSARRTARWAGPPTRSGNSNWRNSCSHARTQSLERTANSEGFRPVAGQSNLRRFRCCASLTHGGFGDAHVFVGASVVEEKTIALPYHAFDENYIRNLTGLLPFHFGREDRIVGARDNLARVFAIEYGNAGAVNVPVVGTVVNQDDTLGREDRRGAGLDDVGVELTGPARENRSVERLGPVDEVGGIRQTHLVSLICTAPQPVHPILAVDLLGDDDS